MSLIRRIVPESVRALIRAVWVRQFRFGISPMDLRFLSEPSAFSAQGRTWDLQIKGGVGGWFPAANHSHGYHGLLHQWFKAYGLGDSSLLVSETREVGATFQAHYTATKFVTTDFYLDLTNQGKTDVLWNLYEKIPDELSGTRFGSVICQATFEHLMDPVGVLRKFAALLVNGGHVYLHTHTPLYGYHGWPRDYLRYFPDWFRDIAMVLPELEIVEIYCVEGHAFAAYRKK